MSANDAQNVFQVDTNRMLSDYRERLAASQENEIRLSAAVGQLMTAEAELRQEIEALNQQVDALSVKDVNGESDSKSSSDVPYSESAEAKVAHPRAMVDGELKELKKAQA